EHYVTYHSLVFLRNNRTFYFSRAGTRDNRPFKKDFYNNSMLKESGTYKIIEDSIHATISTMFFAAGNRLIYLKANYIGYMKNRDTILGWKMIPPYPKIKLRFNEFFPEDTTAKMLYFIKNDAVGALEEIANKKDE